MSAHWLCVHVKDIFSAMCGDGWLTRNVSTFDSPFSSLIQPLRLSATLRQVAPDPEHHFTNGIHARSPLPARSGTIEAFCDGLSRGVESIEIAVLAYRPVVADSALSAVVVLEVEDSHARATVDALASQMWASDNPVLIPCGPSSLHSEDGPIRHREEMWLTAVAFAQSAAFEGALSRTVNRADAVEEYQGLESLYAEVREATRLLWWPYASYDPSLQRYYQNTQDLLGSKLLHEQALNEIQLMEAGARAKVAEIHRERDRRDQEAREEARVRERARERAEMEAKEAALREKEQREKVERQAREDLKGLENERQTKAQELDKAKEGGTNTLVKVVTLLAGVLALAAIWVSTTLVSDPPAPALALAIMSTFIVIAGLSFALKDMRSKAKDVEEVRKELRDAEARVNDQRAASGSDSLG